MYKKAKINNIPSAFVLLISLAFTSACLNTENVNITPKRTIKNITVTDNIITQSSLLNAILDSPEIKSNLALHQAALVNIEVEKTAQNFRTDVTASGGLHKKFPGNSNAATANINAYKLINDSGQTDRKINLAINIANQSKISANILIDQHIEQLLQAYVKHSAAEKRIKVFDTYFNVYREKEVLITSAVEQGFLSNSNYLEIKKSINKLRSDKAKAKLDENTSHNFLKLKLNQHYVKSIAEIEKNFAPSSMIPFDQQNTFNQKLLKLKENALDIKLELQKANGLPLANLQTSITSPNSTNTSATLFAGVSISFFRNDGGKSVKTIKRIKEQLKSIRHEKQNNILKMQIARKELESFKIFYDLEKKILIERKRDARDQLLDLDLLLKAGKIKIHEYINVIITNSEIDLYEINLETELLNKILAVGIVSNQTCSLIALCDRDSLILELKSNVNRN